MKINQFKSALDAGDPVAVAVVAFFEGDFRRTVAALSVAADERAAAGLTREFIDGVTAVFTERILQQYPAADRAAVTARVEQIAREAFADIEQHLKDETQAHH